MPPWPGNAYPLGATYDGAGTNFALFSEVAEQVELCLFDADGQEERVRLTEMDGFDPRTGVIVLGATNRPEILDPALLRPGRFDRRVVVSPPDRAGREAILRVHTRGVPIANDVKLGDLAAAMPGMVGADLENLVNEAALLAARRDHEKVNREDLTDAL